MPVQDFKWVFCPCPHFGCEDKPTVRKVIKQIEDHQPDFIILGGDVLDCQAMSSHAKYQDWELSQEWARFRNFLIEVREVCPGHKLVYLDGNHEDRINKGQVPKDIRGALNWENWLPPKGDSHPPLRDMLDGSIRRPYVNRRSSKRQRGGTWSLGQVTFYHGYEIGISAERNQAKRFVDDWGLGVSCHTHQPTPVTQVIDPGKVRSPKWYCNGGTWIDWEANAEYADRFNTDGWGHGMVIGESRCMGEGREYRQSKQWDAEVVVWDTVWQNGRA